MLFYRHAAAPASTPSSTQFPTQQGRHSKWPLEK